MDALQRIWESYCDYFVAEWPHSLMWTVAVVVGVAVAWALYRDTKG